VHVVHSVTIHTALHVLAPRDREAGDEIFGTRRLAAISLVVYIHAFLFVRCLIVAVRNKIRLDSLVTSTRSLARQTRIISLDHGTLLV
jgi:hypothetical protein